MNYKNYEKKHVYGVIGFLIIILIPYASILFPFIVADVLFASNLTWFFQFSNETYLLYGAGFLLWGIAALTLAFRNVDKKSIVISVFILFFSTAPLTFGVLHHKELSDEGIAFHNLMSFEIQKYTWEEVDHVVFHLSKERSKPSNIEIKFKDGKQIMFVKNDHFTANYYLFTQKMRDHNIAYADE
ncbi:hypothetical protein HMPREF3291_16220 [Bacillus sp. HMSC76G11]|uniref:hypothetical protein n=1 Tax=Metabacillus idriensis TaxID=324768 RepID=UPI0008A93DDC|nr:hypothetical protein [Metabacillus idriensis]OHR63606.1 hypothetical protein HMPREF3291_16220 [Bacillus sp. HMSC76G11]